MYPSIATVCLSGTLQEKLAAIAAAGIKHIEIFENDLVSFDGSVKDAASLIHDHRLQVGVFYAASQLGISYASPLCHSHVNSLSHSTALSSK